jgi:DNA-binding response OmpR family regulator
VAWRPGPPDVSDVHFVASRDILRRASSACRSDVDPLEVSNQRGPLAPPDGVIRRVLLVEDHADIRATLRANLEYQGFKVLEASSAPEGIDLVEGHHPDLVVLDLMLPVKDGWWFLREVQQCPAPRPVVMVLSARSGQAERLMARTLGAADFIVKPFEPAEVVGKIQSLIGRKENQHRHVM